jgi:uncharacterized damage-inducible protein DinB
MATPSLYEFLRQRLESGYRQLLQAVEGLTEEDARRGADSHWRRYRYGAGLDGSIAGIVWHVAAWKHVMADGLDSRVNAFPDAEAVLPHEPGWSGLRAWLISGQARLLRALDETSAEGIEREVAIEGQRMPVWKLLAHMVEHDHYHAGQINLLRQHMGHVLPD